jgi:hypothetical protein
MSDKPTHDLLIYENEDDKYPTRVGAAWPTKNGKGFSLKINKGVSIANCETARIVLLERREKRGKDA